LIKTEAFVLGSLKYKDSSLIVHVFSEVLGFRSYMLKGILTSKRGKIKPSYFQPLTQLKLIVTDTKQDQLGYIKECSLQNSLLQDHSDPLKGPMLLFLCEVLASVLKEENDPNPGLYTYLKTTLNWLENTNKLANFHLKFLLDLTRFMGFYPNTSQNEAAYFDLESGCYSDLFPGGKNIQGSLLLLFNPLLGMNFEEALKVAINKSQRTEILHTILSYYSFHLQGFKHPKSLKVLHEIFELY